MKFRKKQLHFNDDDDEDDDDDDDNDKCNMPWAKVRRKRHSWLSTDWKDKILSDMPRVQHLKLIFSALLHS